MNCPHCRSTATSKRMHRTALGYLRFSCGSCHRRFNERTGTPFNDLQFPTNIVLLAVLWRLRYKLGFRDVAELLLQRGYEVTHETVVLLKTADVTAPYAVGSNLKPRLITPGQLIMAVECGPDEAAKPLPEDTNARVMAALQHFQHDVSSRLGRARRPGTDTRLRRYLSKQLNLAREDNKDDPAELQRIGVLQRIFLNHLPGNVLAELAEVRKMELEGVGLFRRLEALRQHFKLNPTDPDDDQAEPLSAEVIRTICSDGLV